MVPRGQVSASDINIELGNSPDDELNIKTVLLDNTIYTSAPFSYSAMRGYMDNWQGFIWSSSLASATPSIPVRGQACYITAPLKNESTDHVIDASLYYEIQNQDSDVIDSGWLTHSGLQPGFGTSDKTATFTVGGTDTSLELWVGSDSGHLHSIKTFTTIEPI